MRLILKVCCKKIGGDIIAEAHDNVQYIIMGFGTYLDHLIS